MRSIGQPQDGPAAPESGPREALASVGGWQQDPLGTEVPIALVVFLRGVNVGGHRVFRPSALAARLPGLGLVSIGTAGTFVVRRRIGRAALRTALRRELPFETESVVCDGAQIRALVAQDVFGRHRPRPDTVRFVSVLARLPRSAPSLPVQFPPAGQWLLKVLARDGRFVVGVYRRHMQVIRHLSTLDRLFGVPVTTRNWNTIVAAAKVLESGAG